MINRKYGPEDSIIAPKFTSIFSNLSKVEVSKIKTKIRQGMKDNRKNEVLIDLFKRWRKYIQSVRPDIETIAES